MVSSKSKNIFIIPARSGSKGIKNKNTQLISGIEMFVWSIIHAKYLSKKNDLIIVTSDSKKYLQIAEKWGSSSLLRSPELSGDKVFTEPVMADVLKKINAQANDKVILLQPTSPLRSKKTLNIVKGHLNNNVNSLLTVKHTYQFEWEKKQSFGIPLYSKRPRRQDMRGSYIENGSIYINSVGNFLKNNNRVDKRAILVSSDEIESIEVDNYEELEIIKSISGTYNKQWKKEVIGNKKINTLVLDIDGVFASNIKKTNSNERNYSTQDSNAISNFIKLGGNVFLISSEKEIHSENLFKKIGIKDFKFNSLNKLVDVKKYLDGMKIKYENVCFVGNDIQDLECIKFFRCSATPIDSNPKVKIASKIQLEAKGGNGAILEVLRLLK